MRIFRGGIVVAAALIGCAFAGTAAADPIDPLGWIIFGNPGSTTSNQPVNTIIGDKVYPAITFGAPVYLTVTGGVNTGGTSGLDAGEFTNVIQDLAPAFAGLGVNPSGDGFQFNEEVGASEILILTFTNMTKVNAVDFRDPSHGDGGGWDLSDGDALNDERFQLWVDDVFVGTFLLNDRVTFDLTGFKFEFRHVNIGDVPSWYLGAINITTTPEPATLALVGVGLAGAAWRRRRRAA